MQPNPKFQFKFEAIGTSWAIDILKIPDSVKITKEQLLKKILERIEQFDQTYSRFRPDSLVSQVSQKAKVYQFPEDSKQLFAAYLKFYKCTDGNVTPLIGKVMEQAGYDANYSLTPQKLSSPAWEEALIYNYPNLKTTQPVVLDFGAAGKGYLTDIIGGLLNSFGIESFCIDAGGDILYHDTPIAEKLRIGLENPIDSSQAIGIAKIHNQSLCASAINRRKWSGFNHVINPHTKTSPTNILATWVVADTGLMADGLATCLFFKPGKELKSHFNFEYLIMYEDNSIEQSNLFPAELFLQ